MRAFWWFKENAIAGMARPGFNAVHWFELPFDEAVLLGWLGQYSAGPLSLEKFRHHLQTYAPKIFPFYKLDASTGARALEIFQDTVGIQKVFGKLAARTQVFDDCNLLDDHIHFAQNRARIFAEIEFCKMNGIRRIVSLTERHHGKDLLQDHFELHHLGIEDLGAPRVEQVHLLAEIIKTSQARGDKLAVHCLAGIGRTSTMLMAAHMVLGESATDLKVLMARQNPTFQLTGPQAEFIQSLQASL